MSIEQTTPDAFLPYREPSILTILTQASFLITSNILNHVVNGLLYCGLLGQILVGVAWGTPGGKILSSEAESTMVQLGYIGLILIIFEGLSSHPLQQGGLSTDFRSLKANILLSTGVALTGIAVPIGLSFILETLIGASKLECFAAGAALCSTSLGTTFTVLRSSGLVNSRLGVVLASAAMLDDVVGLVMVQIVANLGDSAHSIDAVTIVRPLLVSIAFAVIAPAVCAILVKPVTLALNGYRKKHKGGSIDKVLRDRNTALISHTLFLVGTVTASSYAGTSNLFAAYIAGAVINWWDAEVPHIGTSDQLQGPSSGQEVYRHYYEPVVQRILQPFFFGSIGFSIPITRMFSGSVVWKGVVYAALMCIGKMVCGLWLIRLPDLAARIGFFPRARAQGKQAVADRSITRRNIARPERSENSTGNEPDSADESNRRRHGHTDSAGAQVDQTGADAATPEPSPAAVMQADPPSDANDAQETNQTTLPNPTKPVSLYPAAIMGSAMVARGEIGFLVSAVAQSRGVFGRREEGRTGYSEIFLLVTWAIVLCTAIGPLITGMLVRRVKTLEAERCRARGAAPGAAASQAVLGVWGP